MKSRVQAPDRGAQAGALGHGSETALERRKFGAEWTSRRIDSLAEVDPENLPTSTDPEFVFNYISLDHVDAGRLLHYTRESFASAPSRARRVLRIDDVLMSTVRPALQGHLLYSGQVSNAVCSTGFAVLRANRYRCDPQFLFAHLFSDVVGAQVQKLLAGSNYPAINSGDVGRLRVTCPPTVAEQRAIAAVLTDMDSLIESLEGLIAKKRAIKRAAMQQLLTGRTRLPGFKEHWGTRQLGEVSEMASGGTPSTSLAANWSGSIPWITGADIVRQSVAKIRRYITEDAVARSATNVVAKGDLLVVSRTGVGKLAIAPCDIAISQDFTGIIPNRKQLTSAFIFRYLDYSRHVLASQNQGTSIKGITRGALAEMVVPVPTLTEQRAIATVLTDMDDDLGALERRLDKIRAIKKGMMQQLLTGAIRLPIPDDTPEGEADGG